MLSMWCILWNSSLQIPICMFSIGVKIPKMFVGIVLVLFDGTKKTPLRCEANIDMFRHVKKAFHLDGKNAPSPTSIFRSMCVQSQLLCTKTTDSAFPNSHAAVVLMRKFKQFTGRKQENSTWLLAILFFYSIQNDAFKLSWQWNVYLLCLSRKPTRTSPNFTWMPHIFCRCAPKSTYMYVLASEYVFA